MVIRQSGVEGFTTTESDNKLHHRRSIRLADHDYSAEGGCFITIITQSRVCLFGEVTNGEVRLNEFGKIVYEEWFRSTDIRHEIELNMDEFVVMPNHIHGIVIINDDQGRGDRPVAPTKPIGPPPKSIGAFVAGYKSAVTKRINILRNTPGVAVWQRNYYDPSRKERLPSTNEGQEGRKDRGTSSLLNAITSTLPITSIQIPSIGTRILNTNNLPKISKKSPKKRSTHAIFLLIQFISTGWMFEN